MVSISTPNTPVIIGVGFSQYKTDEPAACPEPSQLMIEAIRAAALEQPQPIAADYVGPATVVAYSVMFNKGEISHAIAYCDTPGGARTVVRSEHKALAQQMMENEFVGTEVLVHSDGSFSAEANLELESN